MINWIRQNTALLSIAGSIVFCISTVAVAYHQLSGLIASQAAVGVHIHDNTRHIDPLRDTQAMEQLIDRIDKLEQRLERSERRRVWTAEEIRRRRDDSK